MSKATEGRETETHCKAQHWNQSVLVHAGNGFTYYSHSVGGQELVGRHGSEICNVGERVHKCHQWDGYEYGTRQVPDKRIGRVDKKSQPCTVRPRQWGGARGSLSFGGAPWLCLWGELSFPLQVREGWNEMCVQVGALAVSLREADFPQLSAPLQLEKAEMKCCVCRKLQGTDTMSCLGALDWDWDRLKNETSSSQKLWGQALWWNKMSCFALPSPALKRKGVLWFSCWPGHCVP